MMTAPATTIRLHPAQQAFLRSNALFRAFCGGIGSGKSWAGSYDLIRRAKPGRLYLILAPTYSMLSDATFRHPDGFRGRGLTQARRMRLTKVHGRTSGSGWTSLY